MSKTPRQEHSHIIPAINYHMTLGALVVLMLLTIWAGGIQLPGFLFLSGVAVNNIVAMFIATIKASFVVMIFMGVKYQTKLVKLWAAVGFVGASLMIGILCDHLTRNFEELPGWEPTVDGAMPRIRPTNADLEKPLDPNMTNTPVRQPKP